ncbi:hypothetical protein [Novosphingobium mangrovi (ex Huang et al. 2023)]|uniref:Uncharacterized protein n=1 Tax=Novosphingobium mangrovi (ex Huang et al. 2023) TaxID=2976432 RepID=A0ABT2I090_9SPHN|nr:hypothetical protein [Novosphingobium mangrovi (ex Huang et al. 2023)]MCT2398037.1 hypothetical protein [Novosphingobium mangrovi (ex Huang et al. 2023)]
MLSKINPSATLAQCWYLRRHVPAGRRRREEGGVVHCTCRYCQRPIRSRDGGRWDLAEGFDLDALAGAARTSHFCVIDTLDDMVIARYVVPNGADEEAISLRMAEIREIHGVEEDDSVLQVRLVQSQSRLQRVH